MHAPAPRPDRFPLAPNRGPAAQLDLGLELRLDAPVPIAELLPGTRFVLEGGGVEGRLVSLGLGSAEVAVRREDGGWTRTTWSLGAPVRKLRS